jgi:hypothetical protein
MSIIGLSMAALPCCAGEDAEAGSAALRVDWPVYPRRADHNTSPRKGIEDGPRLRVKRVPIALAEADQRTSGRGHQRRLTSPPLPSRGARRSAETGKYPAPFPCRSRPKPAIPACPARGSTDDRSDPPALGQVLGAKTGSDGLYAPSVAQDHSAGSE